MDKQMEKDLRSLPETKFMRRWGLPVLREAVKSLVAEERHAEVDELTKMECYAELIAELGDEEGPVPAKVEDEPPAQKAIPAGRGSSDLKSPVKAVWHIADQMFFEARVAGGPLPRRKDVQAECMRQGIAYYTARTQYQAWFKHTAHGKHLLVDGNVPAHWSKSEPNEQMAESAQIAREEGL